MLPASGGLTSRNLCDLNKRFCSCPHCSVQSSCRAENSVHLQQRVCAGQPKPEDVTVEKFLLIMPFSSLFPCLDGSCTEEELLYRIRGAGSILSFLFANKVFHYRNSIKSISASLHSTSPPLGKQVFDKAIISCL